MSMMENTQNVTTAQYTNYAKITMLYLKPTVAGYQIQATIYLFST
jgi:hypothetical protein